MHLRNSTKKVYSFNIRKISKALFSMPVQLQFFFFSSICDGAGQGGLPFLRLRYCTGRGGIFIVILPSP